MHRIHEASFDYCVQADVNVSLTSISLLWNASDLLGKLYTKARSSSRSSLELEPVPNGNSGSPGAQLDSEQYQELVRLLYGALQVGHLLPLHSSLFRKVKMIIMAKIIIKSITEYCSHFDRIKHCFWPDRHYKPVTQCE